MAQMCYETYLADRWSVLLMMVGKLNSQLMCCYFLFIVISNIYFYVHCCRRTVAGAFAGRAVAGSGPSQARGLRRLGAFAGRAIAGSGAFAGRAIAGSGPSQDEPSQDEPSQTRGLENSNFFSSRTLTKNV